MESKIRISGNIVSELSEKIPSNIIALNELVKNSYDAGASNVDISLDTEARQLVVSDDGSGMNIDDIHTLFHISDSEKKYGQYNKKLKRYTQGSKGLGFLSVFKFGKQVTWYTKKNKGLSFSLNIDQIVSADDITEFSIQVSDEDSLKKGTKIVIDVDSYNTKFFKEYFNDPKNYKKIICAFDDKTINVNLQIDTDKYSSNDQIDFSKNAPDQQLFYVTYDSKKQEIKIYYKKYLVLCENFRFASKKFKLSLELLIFHLTSHGKSKIDQLFFNPQNDLTPLIYVNSNLFNNYTIFDPGVMKNIRSSDVMNQMIGYVRIISDDEQINFNSDRTQFLQNELTGSIIDYLSEINKKIQTLAARSKPYLVKFNFFKEELIPFSYKNNKNKEDFRYFIHDDFKFKKDVEIKLEKGKVVYTLFGRSKTIPILQKEEEADNSEIVPARIFLTKNRVTIEIPSQQVALRDFVREVRNSAGQLVNPSELTICESGFDLPGGILHSIEIPCEKRVDFKYNDVTGPVVEQLVMSFRRPESEVTGAVAIPQKLITLPSKDGYSVDFNPHVSNLINQINQLDYTQNLELISCSLRSLFELSVDSICMSQQCAAIIFNHSSLDARVVAIIDYISANNHIVSEIAISTKIDFHSLNNMLDSQQFESAVKKAHLGVHKTFKHLTKPMLEETAKWAALFVVLTNELLNCNNSE